MNRFDRYTNTPGFDMVVAYVAGDPVGLTWGWPLKRGSSWWDGLLTDLGADFTNETGQRTFALSEIMVASEWMGQGVAHALHDELLAAPNHGQPCWSRPRTNVRTPPTNVGVGSASDNSAPAGLMHRPSTY